MGAHLSHFDVRVKTFSYAVFVPVFVLITGCLAVGPDYVPPDPSLPGKWHTPQGGAGIEDSNARQLAGWWSTLGDPFLTKMIEEAISGNLDLKEAKARVKEARARRGISRADRFPTIEAAGSARVSRSSGDTGRADEGKLYAAGFDASWELDLFGGKRRAVEAAEAELQASEEDLRDVLVSLLAEVALNYVEVRSFQARLAIALEGLEAQQGTYNIACWRFEAGLATRLDVEQAKYNLEQTRAQIPGLRVGLEQAKNRLCVLLGQHPGLLEDALAERKAIPAASVEAVVGVPADLLRRRPDIRRSERKLASHTAQVGVATADLYPKFSLLGSVGLEALSSTDLFLTSSRTHSIGPSLAWPIFDAGAIRKRIAVQNALQEQALIQYESTVLKALEEVENALTAFAEEQRRRESLSDATQAAQEAMDLAMYQYTSGLADFTDVLDAERSLLSFKGQLADSQGKATSSLITLYKALGGGWRSFAPDRKEVSGMKGAR